MLSRVRNEIATLAEKEIGNANSERYGGRSDLWCSAFLVWVYRSVGLDFGALDMAGSPGATLRGMSVKTTRPEVGDFAYYPMMNHYALVVDVASRSFSYLGVVVTVDGSKAGQMVTVNTRRVVPGVEFYSIEDAIRRYEMTGASTGEV
jgi:hypothetical protein